MTAKVIHIRENSKCRRHHHQSVLTAQIILTLPHHLFLSVIALGKSSKLHCVCIELMNISFCLSDNTGVSMCRNQLDNITYEFVFISPVLTCLTWIVFEMEGIWPYSCCFVGCCFKDFFKTACSILVSFPSIFSPGVSLKSKWCNHTIVLIWLQLERIPIKLLTFLYLYFFHNLER